MESGIHHLYGSFQSAIVTDETNFNGSAQYHYLRGMSHFLIFRLCPSHRGLHYMRMRNYKGINAAGSRNKAKASREWTPFLVEKQGFWPPKHASLFKCQFFTHRSDFRLCVEASLIRSSRTTVIEPPLPFGRDSLKPVPYERVPRDTNTCGMRPHVIKPRTRKRHCNAFRCL